MKILRVRQVAEVCGWSTATTWRKAKVDPNFPKPVKMSGNCTGWIDDEVQAYIKGRVAAARQNDNATAAA